MVNLEEARFWQESSFDWYCLRSVTENRDIDECLNRDRYRKRAAGLSRRYMGITDQDQLYA